MKVKEKKEARRLRNLGFSINSIARALAVSKGSVGKILASPSLWGVKKDLEVPRSIDSHFSRKNFD